MTVYPKMKDKDFKALPEVFREIIEYDERDPRKIEVVNLSDAQDYLERVKDWKQNRNNLSEGARRSLQKQRGGPVNA